MAGHKKSFVESEHFRPVLVALLLVYGVLSYVSLILHMTALERHVAEDVRIKETLVDEQERLRLELTQLRSPRRIEAIAIDRLGMQYRGRRQKISVCGESVVWVRSCSPCRDPALSRAQLPLGAGPGLRTPMDAQFGILTSHLWYFFLEKITNRDISPLGRPLAVVSRLDASSVYNKTHIC